MTHTANQSAEHRGVKRLGEILVDAGVLDKKTLEESLARKGHAKLGRYLVERDIVNEHDIVSAMSRQLGFEVFMLTTRSLDRQACSLLTTEAMTKYHMIPVCVEDGRLLVAMTDPLDSAGYDEAVNQSPYPIEVLICTRSEFERAYAAACGAGGGMDMDDGQTPDPVMSGFRPDVDLDSGIFGDGDGDDPEVSRALVKIFRRAVAQGASDIHISPQRDGVSIRFRVDGRLRRFKHNNPELLRKCVSKCKVASKIDIAMTTRPQDGGFSMVCDGRDYSVRTSVLPTVYGGNTVMRILGGDMGKFALSKLGMPDKMHREFSRSLAAANGMIILTGPTGSGKSTSLYSATQEIITPDKNTITIEDPVEYRMRGAYQVQINPKAGLTFPVGLKAILRQDPDNILLGEIRDRDTADIAVRASLTGHKVLTTIHANDAPGVVVRLLEMGIEPYIVASVLRMCVSQRLVRRMCPSCAETYVPERYLLDKFGLDGGKTEFKRGKGCPRCANTGFSGRIAVFESMVVDGPVRDAILSRDGFNPAALPDGCVSPLADDAVAKVLSGLTTLEEVAEAVLV